MTKRREKPALMPQSNYSTEIQNKKNMVKLLMHSVSRFLHIPNLISLLTVPLNARVFVPLFIFLLSHLSLLLSCILWPLREGSKREGGRVTYERGDGIRNVTEQRDIKWQFPSDPKVVNSIPHRTPADILYVQQLDWLILHSVQVPRLSAPNQWLIQEHIQSACHVSAWKRMRKKLGSAWCYAKAFPFFFFFFLFLKIMKHQFGFCKGSTDSHYIKVQILSASFVISVKTLPPVIRFKA